MAESPPALDAMFEAAVPIVERVVRQRFRVSLSRADDRAENERARDCVQDTLLQLGEKFQRVAGGVDPAIDDVANYAARVAHNTVNEQLRSSVPDRARLKNRLRHVLRTDSAFDTWEDRDGALLAGYSGWRLRQARTTVTPVVQSELRTGALLTTPWPHMKRTHWVALLTRVFDLTGGPLDLDDLLGCLGELLGVSTRLTESIDDDELHGGERDGRLADDTLTPEETAVQVEELRRLWACVRGLRREWLFAFLLNPPGLGDGRRRDSEAAPHRGTLRGEIDVFPARGVASIAEIGDLLALTAEQCRALSSELGGSTQTAERPVPFHDIWRHLPLKDRVIGSLLGKTGGQVIGLRVLAVRQLAGCLGVRVRPESAGHSGPPRSSASGKGA
jgi:DNA-directed RNA polymerase specialized sigma24 family protein